LASEIFALLDRYGVVTRGSVLTENAEGGFGAAYRALSSLEEAGQCRRGYFVEGLGAAQFALTGAVDRLRTHQRQQSLVPSYSRPAIRPTRTVQGFPGRIGRGTGPGARPELWSYWWAAR
jgi:ATP-dependent Lhr-like helicase